MVYLQMSMGGDLCVRHQVDYNTNSDVAKWKLESANRSFYLGAQGLDG